MDTKATRITLNVISACSFLIPLLMIVFGDQRLGAILLLAGLATTYQALRFRRRMLRQVDPQRQNQARRVMVPLLDESGAARDEAAAARALQQARHP